MAPLSAPSSSSLRSSGPAVPGEVRPDAAFGSLDDHPRGPQPRALDAGLGVGRPDNESRAAGHADAFAGPDVGEVTVRIRGGPQFHHPKLFGALYREVHDDGPPGTAAVNRGRQGGGVVHHEQIARSQEITEVREPGVADPVRSGDEQFDTVPGDAVRFRRLDGVGARGATKLDHGSAPDNRSAAR